MCTLTAAADHDMKNVNDDDINNKDNISDRIMMMYTMTIKKLLIMKSCWKFNLKDSHWLSYRFSRDVLAFKNNYKSDFINDHYSFIGIF